MNKRSIQTAYVAGAFFGLTGVIAGAMGAHALEKVLEPSQLDSFETAVRFQMYHGLFLIIMGSVQERIMDVSTRWITWLTIIGTLLFSGSIYLLLLTPLNLGIMTPIGGSVLIVSWAWLLLWGIRRKMNL